MRRTLAIVLLVVAPIVVAQATGSLVVRVEDAEGRPLPGATVTIRHETGNVAATAELTDAAGEVRLPVLRAGGGYSVEVAFPGMATLRQGGLRVPIDETRTHVVTLEASIERVTVTDTRNVVDVDRSAQSSRFSDTFVAELPIQGNAYQNVLTLAPGVNDSDDDGNPTVHGSRSRDFKTVVSGVNNVDPLTGRFFANINPNSIEAIEIVTAAASLDNSGAQGGYANIVQKQGTNRFEGALDVLYNSDRLDGSGANSFDRLAEPEFERYDVGLSLSGPVVRDRLWFFLAHNAIDSDDPLVTAGGTEVIRTEQRTIADSLTWQATPRTKLTLRYLADPAEITAANVSLFVPRESSFSTDSDIETWSLGWETPYSTRIFLSAVLSLQRLDYLRRPTDPNAINRCVPYSILFGRIQCENSITQQTTGPWLDDFASTTERTNLRGDATIFVGRRWGAEHQLKLGVEMTGERYHFTRDRRPTSFFQEMTVSNSFFGTTTLQAMIIDFSVPPDQRQRATANRFGFYVEDQIKPTDRLTVTLGARLDREQTDSHGFAAFSPAGEVAEFFDRYEECVGFGNFPGFCSVRIRPQVFTAYDAVEDLAAGIADQTPSYFSTSLIRSLFTPETRTSFSWAKRRAREDLQLINDNVSPYLSVKYDPFGDGKTAIGGSFRRYYNNLFLLVPLSELAPPIVSVTFRPGFFTGSEQPSINASLDMTVVSRDLRTPYQDETTLAIEREIFPETALRLSWIRRDYRDQLQDVNINRLPGDFGRCRRAELVDTRTLEPSLGTGMVYDPFSEEWYMDTDPGIGDGIVDDCNGDIVVEFFGDDGPTTLHELFALQNRLERPDGRPDLYVQNPAFGDIFEIGNSNSSRYEAFTLELTRRRYRNWEMQGSYTWSTSRGNGDAYDQTLIGDDPTLDDTVAAFQASDIRHVVTVSAGTITPWGIRVGAVARWQSGLPFSLIDRRLGFLRSIDQIGRSNPGVVRSSYIGGLRNTERNAPYWNVDLRIAKELRIGRAVDVQLSAQAFNLLDDDTEIIYNRLSETGQRINGTNDSFRRFGRQWELGLKLAF